MGQLQIASAVKYFNEVLIKYLPYINYNVKTYSNLTDKPFHEFSQYTQLK